MFSGIDVLVTPCVWVYRCSKICRYVNYCYCRLTTNAILSNFVNYVSTNNYDIFSELCLAFCLQLQ